MTKFADWQLRRRRCNAKCKQQPLRYCRNWCVRGRTRCKFHGGMSTGPKTAEGKARVVAAMVEGRRRWLAQLKAEGRKFPRKPRVRVAKASKVMAPVRARADIRKMSPEEIIEAGKEALRVLRERFERTGSLGR